MEAICYERFPAVRSLFSSTCYIFGTFFSTSTAFSAKNNCFPQVLQSYYLNISAPIFSLYYYNYFANSKLLGMPQEKSSSTWHFREVTYNLTWSDFNVKPERVNTSNANLGWIDGVIIYHQTRRLWYLRSWISREWLVAEL